MNKCSRELVNLIMALPLQDSIQSSPKLSSAHTPLMADSSDPGDSVGTFEIELNIDPSMVKEIDNHDSNLDTDQDSSNDEDFDFEYQDFEEMESFGELCFIACKSTLPSSQSGHILGLPLSGF